MTMMAFPPGTAAFQPSCRINLTPGNKTASYDCFTVTFLGKGGHGAQPQNTIDPINAAVHAYTALQALISRECPPAEPAVLTIGTTLLCAISMPLMYRMYTLFF